MVVATLLAIGCMVGWLIVNHEMSERGGDKEARELAALYNAATVSPLLIGVTSCTGDSCSSGSSATEWSSTTR
jgi:hypothetical protein